MKKFLLLLTFNFALSTLNCFCGVYPEPGRRTQNKNTSGEDSRTIDSLLILIKTDKADTTKVNHLITLCNEYRKVADYNNGLKYGNEALTTANSLTEGQGRSGASSAYNNIGNIYYNQGNYPQASKNYIASLQINEELKNKKDIAGSYFNIG